MSFFKNVFATIVGLFLFILLSFFFLIGLGALISSGDDEVKIKDNSVIQLDLAKINFAPTQNSKKNLKLFIL